MRFAYAVWATWRVCFVPKYNVCNDSTRMEFCSLEAPSEFFGIQVERFTEITRSFYIWSRLMSSAGIIILRKDG